MWNRAPTLSLGAHDVSGQVKCYTLAGGGMRCAFGWVLFLGACGPSVPDIEDEGWDSGSEAESLVGKTYSVDVASGRFVEPDGIGSLLAKQFEDRTVFLSPTAQSVTELHLRAAAADDTDGTAQSACDKTVELPAADFTQSPAFGFDATGSVVVLSGFGVDVDVHDLAVSGTFTEDGTAIQSLSFAGLVDTRHLGPLVDVNSDDDTVCDLMGSIGVSCKDCGTGDVFCLDVRMAGLTGIEVSGMTLTALDDVCAQPDAATTCVDACVNGTVSPLCSVTGFGLGAVPGLLFLLPFIRRKQD